MAGSVEGGRKAAKTNKERHGNDFFRIIGSKGGQAGHTGGFAANPELASRAGAIGGRISKRTGKTTGDRKVKEFIWKGGPDATLSFKKTQ